MLGKRLVMVEGLEDGKGLGRKWNVGEIGYLPTKVKVYHQSSKQGSV
jgi:hypothetical protein